MQARSSLHWCCATKDLENPVLQPNQRNLHVLLLHKGIPAGMGAGGGGAWCCAAGWVPGEVQLGSRLGPGGCNKRHHA